MLNAALVAYFDALSIQLKNQVEKRSVLDNLDVVLLCLDETIDDGYVSFVAEAVIQFLPSPVCPFR